MKYNMKKAKLAIQEKDRIKKNYKVAFSIVKKHIDHLDIMGLFEMGCPKDEYECEVSEIVRYAIRTKNESELADIISRIFNETFNENFSAKREQVLIISTKIIQDIQALKTFKKETYFIPKDLLPGSCYFEFQQGKYSTGKYRFSKMGETKLDSSIYLYGNDDRIFDYSAIAPFAYIISGSHPNPKEVKFFDYCGVTYIDESDGKALIENLRKFAFLLGSGKEIIEALEILGLYNPTTDASWGEDDSVAKLDLNILKNTAEELADWSEKTLTEFKMISVIGI